MIDNSRRLLRTSDRTVKPGLFEPKVKVAQRQLTLQAMAFFAVADFCFQRREKIEGDVGRLETLWVGVSNVVHQRTEG